MKFSIRDVLWLTAAVAIFVAWGLDHVRLIRLANHRPVREIQLGDWQSALSAGEAIKISHTPDGTIITETVPPTPDPTPPNL